ncbi:O-antigen ligase family protein [Leptospira idonii]|uniref:O-antigen ligase domain-containing protein n=1 Tax=Leptospira idonii TaxID=1193500 RepID=A0A4R9LVN9_9LEPT|nr:O-antigen ligase family protein [Leptospira idonii]TGN18314.1 O-antigen ligase domain-containing protein [Leptospira idonii]
MTYLYQIISLLYSLFLVFSVLGDQSLIVARNNLLFYSFSLLLLGSIKLSVEKIKENFLFLLLSASVLVSISYSAQTHLVYSELVNKQFLRSLHYGSLFYLIYLYRKCDLETFRLYALGIVLGMHSLYFMVDEFQLNILLGFLVLFFLTSKSNRVSLKTFYLFLFGVLVAVFTWIVNGMLFDSVTYFLYYFVSFFLILIVSKMDLQRKKQLLRILFLFLLAEILFLNFSVVHKLLKKENVINSSFVLAGSHISQIGAVALLGLLISFFARSVFPSRKTALSFALILFLGTIILLFLSNSRTSQYTAILSAGFVGVYWFLSRQKKGHLWILLSLLIGVLTLFVFTNPKAFAFSSVESRNSIWYYHLTQTIMESPLFGFGAHPETRLFFYIPWFEVAKFTDRITDYFRVFHAFPQAHNIYIQWFSSFGIVGTVFFLCCLLYLLYSGLKTVLSEKLEIFNLTTLSYLVLFAFAIHGLMDLNAFESPLMIPISVFIGFLISSMHPTVSGKFRPTYLFSLLMFAVLAAVVLNVTKIRMIGNVKHELSKSFFFHNLKVADLTPEPKKLGEWKHPYADTFFSWFPSEEFSQYKALYFVKLNIDSPGEKFISEALHSLGIAIQIHPNNPVHFHLIHLHLSSSLSPKFKEEVFALRQFWDPFKSITE